MSLDVNSDEYIEFEKQIKRRRAAGEDWEDIKTLHCKNEEELKNRLEMISFNICVNNISIAEWNKIVEDVKLDEENGLDTTIILPQVMIPRHYSNDKYEVDNHKGSAWQAYKKVLIDKKFEESTIKKIESSSTHILNKLSDNTINDGPVKGLVIGNVQSGKTANMAALMAMAADNGFNMFIVLSGTIENLRKQTQERLRDDLGAATNVVWTLLDNVNTSRNYYCPMRSIQVNEDSKQRYFMVCLKNPKRLRNLISWLRDDLSKREKLKILLIDDEADQAGVNTADLSEEDRSTINRLLVQLVTGKDEDNNKIEKQYQAMNYVGYTATPYANILNETPGENSLYPSDFVACLEASNSYIGPQHIFGLQELDMDGMDIVNEIEIKDIDLLADIYSNITHNLPPTLMDAIYWFYCTFAIQKHKNIIKPVSMLIHTSSKQKDHQALYNAIIKWFGSMSYEEFEVECKRVYEEQIFQFSLNKFKESYPKYSYKVDDYLFFDEFKDELKYIFNKKIKQIKLLDEDGHLEFSEGVHLCIDNCAHNKIENDNEVFRLFYPNDENNVDYTTGFIVIGGTTLSRGLTIEGLTCSYFLRTVRTADTLMQMGRWFGYRIGYELLPRLWMSNNTKDKFEFLSILDYKLRCEMKEMEIFDRKPSLVGVKVMSHPDKRFLDITSKNKQQQSVVVDADFSGLVTQTTIFYEDENILKNNYDYSIDFINSLGKPIDLTNHSKIENTYVWENISNEHVLNYLGKMKFPKNTSTFLDVDLFANSYQDLAKEIELKDWNVVLAGVKDADAVNKINIGNIEIATVNRSKKIQDIEDGLIRIGALRSLSDLYVDIDMTNSNLTDDDIISIKASKSNDYKLVRNHAGLNNKSLLIIYVIDHSSKPKAGKKETRTSMGTKNDVIGITILIPERSDGKNKGTRVRVKLEDKFESFSEVEA